MLSPKKIGEIFKRRRESKKLMLEDLEARLRGSGVSIAMLSRIENGKISWKETKRLLQLCEVLEVKPKDILGDL